MESNKYEDVSFEKVYLEKEIIIDKLKKNGCRITKQRRLILDIILNMQLSSCKEIYSEALKKDPSVGIATVYRLINNLEEIGAISRKNLYKISYNDPLDGNEEWTIILRNKEIFKLSPEEWKRVLKVGLLEVKGLDIHDIDTIILKKCEQLLEVGYMNKSLVAAEGK